MAVKLSSGKQGDAFLSDSAPPRIPLLGAPGQRGPVTVWAAAGVIWLIISGQAYVRWLVSPTESQPAPILGPDVLAPWRLVSLRVLEAVSLIVLAGFVWFCVVKPWRQAGRLSLDGKFVLGGMVAFASDACLNLHSYYFAWNSHSINWGVWTRYLPFHQPDAPTRYAESFLWGLPMYVYFCAGVAILACQYAMVLRRRFPGMSTVALFTIIWIGEFLFDFIIENIIIRTTHAYAYVHTYAPLTLWAGEVHQFPVYESILVASLGCVYTWMRMAALDDPEGLSPVERGFRRWHPSLQGPVRTLAVIGFCSMATILVYNLPWQWLNIMGSSVADLPSYLLPG